MTTQTHPNGSYTVRRDHKHENHKEDTYTVIGPDEAPVVTDVKWSAAFDFALGRCGLDQLKEGE